MRYGFFAILLLFFCLPASQSLAASKAVLRLGGFQHWADLSYGYAGANSSRGDETEHRFEERYTLLGKYAVLNPRIWYGDFAVSLGLEQESMKEPTGRQKKAGSELEYQVNGILFSRRPASVGLAAFSRTMRRSQLNAPDYDLRSDRYKISLSLRNKKLPTHFIYQVSTSETDGLSIDRRTATDHFQVQTTNSLGPSQTELNLRMIRQRTEFSREFDALSSSLTDVSLENRLELGGLRRPGTLHSHLFYVTEEGDETENERLAWSENLDWRLGKALTSGVRYSLARSSNTLSAERDETRSQAGGAFLQHQLFQSLVTRLDLSGELQKADDGRQEERRIGLDLSYRKKLGERTSMTLGIGGGYGVTDRKFETGLRTALGVSLSVQEVDNFLPDTGILPETVVVRSADRTIVYLEGTDYLLSTTGQITELIIPLGSVITLGQVLSIDYRFLVDPSVRYGSRTFRSSGSLNLLRNQIQFFYQFAQSWQDLLEGEATSQSLTNARSLRAGAMIQRGGHRFRLTYGNQRTPTNPSDFVEGLWNYSRKLLRGRWAVQLVDTYTMYRGISESSQGGSRSNSLQASTSYSRVWGNKSLNTRAFYYNSSGRNNSRENLSMELEYAITLGKTQISLASGAEWEWDNGNKSQNERVQIRLRRYF